MSTKSFVYSAILHGAVLTMMALDFSFAKFDKTPPPPALLLVDLTKVQITDKTNLPPKKIEKKKTDPKQQPKPKTEEKVKTTKVAPPPPEPPKPLPKPPVKEASPIIEPPKPKTETKKEEKVPEKKQVKTEEPPRAKPQKTDLKSLLASVEKIKKPVPQKTIEEKTEKKEPELNEGIENGTGGSFSQILTISERDLIATQLTKCWNVDAGKEYIENKIIEIRTKVNKDGSVREVKILNKPTDAVYRSVAESAERAVWICDKKGTESPFKILAEKYADHYNDWQDITLRFNPLTGGVL